VPDPRTPPDSSTTSGRRAQAHTFPAIEAALAGRYVFERLPDGNPPLIGIGGMAEIYSATEVRGQRRVAVKVLQPAVATALGPERFLQEIQIASRLTHPNILPLLEAGSFDRPPGSPLLWYSMPLMPGGTLRDRMEREGQLPIPVAVSIAAQVADGLVHAHQAEVVHRDIKPENILLDGDRACLADFGLAKAVSQVSDWLTSAGLAVGTPAYMSPEQSAPGSRLDGRSDVYSLGCVLYEMLGGEPPFTGPSAQAVMVRHQVESPRSLRVIRPTVPAALDLLVARTLAKVPADRYPSAAALSEALVRLPEQAADPAEGIPKRRRWRRLAVGVAGLSLGLAGLWRLGPGRAPGPLKERDWLLIADFTAPPGEPGLAVALRELVTVELNQSKYLSTMPHSLVRQALRDAGMPETTAVTEERARELALRSSVRAVVSGRITPTAAGRYAATVEVTDAATGGSIVAAAGSIVLDSFAVGVQELARGIRKGLGERRAEVEADRPLYRVATPSFPAFLKYTMGLDLAVAGNIDGSNRVLFEALALDTGFSAAWAAIGMNYVSSRNLDSARMAYAEALKRPDRLSDAQRYRLEGDAAYALHHDLGGAVRAYSLFLREVPSSIGGRSNLALYLSSMGRYEDALREVDSAIILNPFGPREAQIELLNRVALLICLGRLDDARTGMRRLTGPHLRYAEFQLAAASDDWRAADSLSRLPIDPADPGFLRFMAATSGPAARAALGAPAAADQELAEAARRSSGSGARWYHRARLLLALAEGRLAERGGGPDSAPAQALLAGLAAAMAGDTARARRYLDRLEPLSARDQENLGSGPELLHALLELRTGRAEAAIARLAPLAATGEHDALSLDRVDSYWLRLVVADAFRDRGQPDSARRYLELALDRRRVPPAHYALRGLVHAGATARLRALTPPAGGQ